MKLVDQPITIKTKYPPLTEMLIVLACEYEAAPGSRLGIEARSRLGKTEKLAVDVDPKKPLNLAKIERLFNKEYQRLNRTNSQSTASSMVPRELIAAAKVSILDQDKKVNMEAITARKIARAAIMEASKAAADTPKSFVLKKLCSANSSELDPSRSLEENGITRPTLLRAKIQLT